MRPRDKKGKFIHCQWEQWQIDKLIELYPNTLTEEVAKTLHRGLYSVRNKAHALGLKKSKEFRAETGRMSSMNPKVIASRFKGGHVPCNKGKKRSEYMSAEAIERLLKTSFQKGHIPHNSKPVDYEKIHKGDGYVYVKAEGKRKMVLKHRHVWEQYHGKIPAGYNIQFKDGNRQNCSIDNLYMISRNNQMNENTIHRYPDDIKSAIEKISRIKKIINKNQ